jgi:hypothetical protein
MDKLNIGVNETNLPEQPGKSETANMKERLTSLFSLGGKKDADGDVPPPGTPPTTTTALSPTRATPSSARSTRSSATRPRDTPGRSSAGSSELRPGGRRPSAASASAPTTVNGRPRPGWTPWFASVSASWTASSR